MEQFPRFSGINDPRLGALPSGRGFFREMRVFEMCVKDDLTFDFVNSILAYYPESGDLRWKVDISTKRRAWMIAGSKNRRATTTYTSVSINGQNYTAHRLAWLLYYREWPKQFIDHINHDGEDNRIVNLRDVSKKENARNRKWCQYIPNGSEPWKIFRMVDSRMILVAAFETEQEALASILQPLSQRKKEESVACQ